MKLFNEHQLLLIQRESRMVLGRKAAGLWLLVLVLTATFFSIAFSKGSTVYLDEKMNDPYTNWVNINLYEAEDINKIPALKEALDEDSLRNYYYFDDWQIVNRRSMSLIDRKDESRIFSTLSYESLSSDLIHKVLSEENVIEGYNIDVDSIDDNSMGIIVTLSAIKQLGYDIHNIPPFLDYHSHSPGADSLGVKLLENDYAQAPLPLLAVVKRLPMNKEIVTSEYLYQQILDNEMFPLSMNHEKYLRELRFFVPIEVSGFTLDKITSFMPDTLKKYINSVFRSEETVQNRLRSWKRGGMYMIYLSDVPTPSLASIKMIEENVLSHFSQQGVVRVYDYNPSTAEGWKKNMGTDTHENMDDYISVHFNRLDSIRSFEHFVKDISRIQIEMTQVHSKENFSLVSNMANILTVALIVFAIIAIVIFIVNMLQSYFQKVRRNLGTFKAFGISTRELTGVYMVIIIGIVLTALVAALLITWCIELLLPIFGLTKEGGAPHLILWNSRTLWAIVIILVSTVASVLVVMRRLLRQTPGDLIYDR